MKTVRTFLLLFCVMCAIHSCSKTEDVILTEQKIDMSLEENQEAEIQRLISFINTLNNDQIQTRGRFWDRIKLFFIGDAWGFGYGVEYTSNPTGGLIAAIAFSVILATYGDEVPRRWWHLNSNWQVYSAPLRDYERIGNDHNKVIYNMMTTDNMIVNGTFSNDYLYNSACKKLKSCGYSYEMSSLERPRLMLMMNELKTCTTVEQLRALMQKECSQRMSELDFVESYVNGLVNRDDKTTVRNYTKQVYAQIDASSLAGSVVSRLKTMIAIAENSKCLWLESE